MRFTRKNVWGLGGTWAPPILWYARGVAAMRARPLAEPTSWRFYAAIHGFDKTLWKQHSSFSSSDAMPTSAAIKRFWLQCQHGTWYFLPWHRGYLHAFEANIRAAVIKVGGPSDWALPYWDYFRANQSKLPPAFASPDWPDGTGNNPLFTKQRYGPANNGNVFIPVNQKTVVNLKPMADHDFTGVSGGNPGFGGLDTGFAHSGQNHGGLESQPHDMVHVLIGGSDPTKTNFDGLMSDPVTAALDPIFWLHHANIDRLWEVWRKNPSTHVNPTDPNWLKGPANVGDRIFSLPMPDGSSWNYIPADMTDLSKLDYNYDDLSPDATAAQPAQRLLKLGASPATAEAMKGAAAVATGKNVELVGANQKPLRVAGSEASTSVQLDPAMRRKVAASLAMNVAAPAPDRIFLNLENVRGLSDAAVFQVYVGLRDDATPADHPDLLAGSVALFGVRKASLPDGDHAGEGLNFVLEITDIVDALHLGNALDVSALNVRIVPLNPVPEAAQITIGRVSIFRQGQ